MDPTALGQIVATLGAAGVIIMLMLQREKRMLDRDEKREELERQDRKEETEAKVALATSLSALASRIEGLAK